MNSFTRKETNSKHHRKFVKNLSNCALFWGYIAISGKHASINGCKVLHISRWLCHYRSLTISRAQQPRPHPKNFRSYQLSNPCGHLSLLQCSSRIVVLPSLYPMHLRFEICLFLNIFSPVLFDCYFECISDVHLSSEPSFGAAHHFQYVTSYYPGNYPHSGHAHFIWRA